MEGAQGSLRLWYQSLLHMLRELQMIVCLGEKDTNNQGKTAEAWLQHQAEKEVWKVRQLQFWI